MRRTRLLQLIAIAGIAATTIPGSSVSAPAPAGTSTPAFVPGEVIVGYEGGAGATRREEAASATGVDEGERIAEDTRELEIVDGEPVLETVNELRDEPGIAYAAPNYITQVSGYVPNDPGRPKGDRGDWRKLQWNFDGGGGVNAPAAWETARERGAEGGRGVTVAVLDSGVAYTDKGRYERAPDLSKRHWARGHDFVSGDKIAYDESADRDKQANFGRGHGTHVAATIRQSTDNGRSVTGLAYDATMMPIRILDVNGSGNTADLIRGIRFAADHGAEVINMSLETKSSVFGGTASRPLREAVEYAHERNAVLVASAGNKDVSTVATPADIKHVIAVGATTENSCQADYSNSGDDLDISAPGGGDDSSSDRNPRDASNCRPRQKGDPIYQETFDCKREARRCNDFGLPSFYEGTSMSTAHVSATAALVMATTGIRDPEEVEQRLEQTARDLGKDGFDDRYGAGLLDSAAAVR